MGIQATERRLRAQVEPRLEPGEVLLGWSRGWVSPDAKLRYLAPRHRDIVVLTDRRLMIWSVGRWLRRPRRRVLAQRLTDLRLEPAAPRLEQSVRFGVTGRKGVLLEFGRDDRSRAFVALLLERGRPAIGGAPWLS